MATAILPSADATDPIDEVPIEELEQCDGIILLESVKLNTNAPLLADLDESGGCTYLHSWVFVGIHNSSHNVYRYSRVHLPLVDCDMIC